MADKQPIQKRGRGRPPKEKQNAPLPTNLPSQSIQSIQPTQNSLNSIITNQPDDIESLVKHIDEKELAMAIDESYASNLSMQINASSIIKNDFDNHDFDNINSGFANIGLEDKDELAIILAEIQEREEQERLDAEFARQLSQEYLTTRAEISNQSNYADYNEDNESFIEETLNQNKGFKGASAPLAEASLASDIRAQQDYEYEESLLKDIAKEEQRIKSQMNIKNAVVEDVEDKDEDDNDEDDEKTDKDNFNIIPEESSLPLTINEIRAARLAFFNKK